MSRQLELEVRYVVTTRTILSKQESDYINDYIKTRGKVDSDFLLDRYEVQCEIAYQNLVGSVEDMVSSPDQDKEVLDWYINVRENKNEV